MDQEEIIEILTSFTKLFDRLATNIDTALKNSNTNSLLSEFSKGLGGANEGLDSAGSFLKSLNQELYDSSKGMNALSRNIWGTIKNIDGLNSAINKSPFLGSDPNLITDALTFAAARAFDVPGKILEGTFAHLYSASNALDSFAVRGTTRVAGSGRGAFGAARAFNEQFQSLQKTIGISGEAVDNLRYNLSDGIRTIGRFGVTQRELFEQQKEFSQILRSNQVLTEEQASILGRVQLTTGLTLSQATKVMSELRFMNNSFEDTEKTIVGLTDISETLGVNAKLVSDSLVKNIRSMRNFTFRNGVEGMTNMVAESEALKTNITEVFAVADKTRTIEGSLEMVSQLRLLGGEFSRVNPFEFMRLARNDPQEFQKRLAGMVSELGQFNKMTGEIEFSPVDQDVIRQFQKITGMSQEAIVDMAVQQNKLNMIRAKGLTQDEQIITKLAQLGKIQDGKIMLDVKGETKTLDRLFSEGFKLQDLKVQPGDTNRLAERTDADVINQQGVAALVGRLAKQSDSFQNRITDYVERNAEYTEKVTKMLGKTQDSYEVMVRSGVGAIGFNAFLEQMERVSATNETLQGANAISAITQAGLMPGDLNLLADAIGSAIGGDLSELIENAGKSIGVEGQKKFTEEYNKVAKENTDSISELTLAINSFKDIFENLSINVNIPGVGQQKVDVNKGTT